MGQPSRKLRTVTKTTLDLGLRTHLDAILDVLGPVSGLEVVDVGCGEGENAQGLAAAGARVSGFDPFIEGTDWIVEGAGRYRLTKASAEALPLDDRCADAVLFVLSLHHVPDAQRVAALEEARRVLKPAGRLLISEPLAEGPSHYVGAPFHDETAVRAAAAKAIEAGVAPHFRTHRIISYADRRTFASFDAYAARMIRARRFNGYTEDAVLASEVRRRFDEMFATNRGAFDQPVRVDLFSDQI